MNTELIAIEEKPLNGEDIAKMAMTTVAQIRVNELAARMKQLPQVEQPLKHHFFPGLYVREILNPKGSLIITKMHKTTHCHVIVKGKISVWIEGVGVKTFTAPHIGETVPGTRRIIYAHEDTIFLTFHVTNKTDIAEIERDCVYEPVSDTLEVDSKIIQELQNAPA